MISEKIKQSVFTYDNLPDLFQNCFPKIFEDTVQEQDNKPILRPHHLIISAPIGTWLYINNDISPSIIDETGIFDYDLKNFAIFDSLYFVFSEEQLDSFNSQKIIITAFYYDS